MRQPVGYYINGPEVHTLLANAIKEAKVIAQKENHQVAIHYASGFFKDRVASYVDPDGRVFQDCL